MNILEAYIKEYGYLHIVFTSVDYKLLKEITNAFEVGKVIPKKD